MKIDNAQLAAFAAAIGEGTFDLAAKKLNVTPSAISQRIKLLEERMGQVLIQRSTPCQVTAAGRPLLRYAEALAVLESEVLAELGVADASGVVSAAVVRIPVVVNADSLDSWFPEVFDALAGVGGPANITLDIRAEDQDHSVALLREGTVMAGVSANAQPIQGCRVEALGVMRYLALASPAYVARYFANGLTAASLSAAPMLMFNKKDALQQEFLARLSDQAIKPPTHFAPTTRSFSQAVERGMAWGMIPEQFAEADLQAGKLVEIAPDHWLDIPLFWHRWRIGSAALETITREVHQAARRALRQGEGG